MNYQFSKRMSTIKASAIREILKATSDPTIISFAGGNPSAEAFPLDAIRKISNQLLEKEPINLLQYGISEGDNELISEAELFLNRSESIIKENDKLLITSGSQQIMEFTVKCFCNDGDIVLTENPSFIGAINAFKSQGAKVKGIGFKNGQLDVSELERVLSKKIKPKFLYVIPNFQNPMGTVMSLKVRKEILALAKKYGVIILEDNPYGDLRFEGNIIPSIKSLDKDGIVIYAASLSKIIAPGMRIACCVADKAIIERFVVAKQVSDIHSNLWSQKVIAKFLQEYDMDNHLFQLSQIYQCKCQLMYNQMKKHFHPDIIFNKPSGGMFIWVTFPKSVDIEDFIKKALDLKVAVVPGKVFLVDDKEECHSIRLNFSTPTDEQIIKGISILGKLTYNLV